MIDLPKRFFDEGFRNYVDAHIAIQHFEDGVYRALLDVLESKGNWRGLRNVKISEYSKAGGGKGIHGRWIDADVEGIARKGEKIQINCGLWWKPDMSPGPIAYASLWEPKRLSSFSYNPTRGGVKSFQFEGRTYLHSSPLKELAALKTAVNRVLDALIDNLRHPSRGRP